MGHKADSQIFFGEFDLLWALSPLDDQLCSFLELFEVDTQAVCVYDEGVNCKLAETL